MENMKERSKMERRMEKVSLNKVNEEDFNSRFAKRKIFLNEWIEK